MRYALAGCIALIAWSSSAAADPTVTVTPEVVRPGDPVFVLVKGAKDEPKGKASGAALHFFAVKGGYRAVFAIPLDAKPAKVSIEIDHASKPATVEVRDTTFPETNVVVEDELANPPKADRDRIAEDNQAILTAVGKSTGEPLFSRPFRRPPGEVTSTFGEWRTFNDGHRSQHLGVDLFAREGAKVTAINAGTVALVRDTFLAGNVVVIVHGAGIASAYFHLSKTSVTEGDAVEQGAVIGLAGHTGRTTGPHLHLTVRVPGGFVDPVSFFKLPLAPTHVANARN